MKYELWGLFIERCRCFFVRSDSADAVSPEVFDAFSCGARNLKGSA